MGDIFLKILNMSITAGWLILAVICIRLVFRKMPKWVNCLLWGVVAVRLICPFSLESQFSILPSAEPVKFSTFVEGREMDYIPSIDSHWTIVENRINPMLSETFAYSESESAAPLQIVTHAAGLVWICGVILLMGCAMGSFIRLHKLVREAVQVRDNLYICDAVRSPFILGILRPRVYLSSALSEKQMHYIMAHEAAHLKRKDHWWKPLGYLLLCIHWFNPLCWAAYVMLCRDIELACDEKVVKEMIFGEKKEYSKVLLSCTGQRRSVMVCPLAFGEVGVKERVKSVLHYKKPAVWIVIASFTICVITAICFLTDPAKEYQIRVTVPPESTGEAKSSLSPERVSDEEAVQTQDMPAHQESMQEIKLYEQPEADKVCIKVQPSMIREHLFYYYIPVGDEQKWLSERIKALDLEGEPLDGRWDGHKETGWQIVYNDVEIRGFEGGYLYYTYEDAEKGMMECFMEEPKLYDYVQIMLMEEIGYRDYDVSDIKDIVSAKLDVNTNTLYSQTITDAETLQKFEEWFSNAKYIPSGTDCGNRYACLELTLANGDVVKLSMATDRCPNFNLNGVTYDYRPVSDWDNSAFYRCFDEIPWE